MRNLIIILTLISSISHAANPFDSTIVAEMKHVNVGEYGRVDALQNIVGRVLPCGRHLVGVVYQSRPERLHAHWRALCKEM